MKVCAVSDLHGDLIDIKPCDLVLICGDSVPLNIQSSTNRTKKWYKEKFIKWAENLPCEKVIFIAGNHELGFKGHQIIYENLFPASNKITYLCHKEYIFTHNGKDYRIFGTPYCKKFGDWAFMYPDDVLKQIFNEIPEGLDILITHDAPYGVSDIVLQSSCSWYDGKTHLGNIPLREAILEKKPKIVVHGHIHSSSREFENLGISKVINCSIVNENYSPVYAPIVFEL